MFIYYYTKIIHFNFRKEFNINIIGIRVNDLIRIEIMQLVIPVYIYIYIFQISSYLYRKISKSFRSCYFIGI